MGGDTSRAEARQVGSGRPRRRYFGGRRRGPKQTDFVIKTGANGMIRSSNLQCIWGEANDFSVPETKRLEYVLSTTMRSFQFVQEHTSSQLNNMFL